MLWCRGERVQYLPHLPGSPAPSPRVTWFLPPTRIHGDEDPTRPHQIYFKALEIETREVGGQGGQDGQDLLGHHRQHLDVDAVKLVKAAPGPALQSGREAESLQ